VSAIVRLCCGSRTQGSRQLILVSLDGESMQALLLITLFALVLGALIIAFVLVIEFGDRVPPRRTLAQRQRRADFWGAVGCFVFAGLVGYAAFDADMRGTVVPSRGTWMSPTQAYFASGLLAVAGATCVAFMFRHRHDG